MHSIVEQHRSFFKRVDNAAYITHFVKLGSLYYPATITSKGLELYPKPESLNDVTKRLVSGSKYLSMIRLTDVSVFGKSAELWAFTTSATTLLNDYTHQWEKQKNDEQRRLHYKNHR